MIYYLEQLFRPKSKELMQLLDKVNHSGRGKIWFAGQGIDPTWGIKREQLSPRYTTQWAQLPIVTKSADPVAK